MIISVPLSKPIKAHDEEISEIVMREPTPDDVMELGYPFIVVFTESESTGIEFRPKVVARYIQRLAQVPASTVKAMTLADLSACQAAVQGFFGADATGTPIS